MEDFSSRLAVSKGLTVTTCPQSVACDEKHVDADPELQYKFLYSLKSLQTVSDAAKLHSLTLEISKCDEQG